MQAIIRAILMIILSLAYSAASHAQDIPKSSLNKIVKEIATHNRYESAHVGVAGIKSRQYTRFESLLPLASVYELEEMATADTNAVVRLYALQALHHKGVTIAAALKKKFAEDKTLVFTLNGCIGGEQTVQSLASSILQQPLPASNAFNTKEKAAQ